MFAVIEWSALSPAQQACLQAAIRCSGLSRWAGHYVGAQHHPQEAGKGHAKDDVQALRERGLLEADGYPVQATDAGIELFNCAQVAREVQP